MALSNHDLRQLDEEVIDSLPVDGVKNLAKILLLDLKEARERLNQNSQNSSRPPSSEAPWDKASGHSNDAADEPTESDKPEPVTEEEALKEAQQADGTDISNEDLPEENATALTSAIPQEIPVVKPPIEKPVRNPGKQPGAKGFGRTQIIPIHQHQDHHPTKCAVSIHLPL